MTPPAAGAAGGGGGGEAVEGGGGGGDGGAAPERMASACALKVVDAAGHPTPGPRRFCRVTVAAFRRASCEA